VLLPLGVIIAVVVGVYIWASSRAKAEIARGRAHASPLAGGTFVPEGPPYSVAVNRGEPGTSSLTDPIVTQNTEPNGAFVLRGYLSEADADSIFVYITSYGFEQSAPMSILRLSGRRPTGGSTSGRPSR
jgi:hypothetical protein